MEQDSLEYAAPCHQCDAHHYAVIALIGARPRPGDSIPFDQPLADARVVYENSGKIARESTAATEPTNRRLLQFFSIKRVGECDGNRPRAK